jgi:hypothetical protein
LIAGRVVGVVLDDALGRVVVDDVARVVVESFVGRVVVVVEAVVDVWPDRVRVVVDGRAVDGLRS